MTARERLAEELREHALVLGEVTLTSGLKAQYYVDAKRAILRRARRRRRREGLLRAQGDQAPRPVAPYRRTAAGGRGPLPGRRGRRQHGGVDRRGDRGAARGRPRDLRRS